MDHFFNLHTHTYYCDGTEHPEKYVVAALKAGFHTLGFSSHAPVPLKNSFAIQDQKTMAEYCQAVRKLKVDYQGKIDILLGLEMDYIRGVSDDFLDLKKEWGLDYSIGSVHLVKNSFNRGLWFIDGPKAETFNKGLQDIFKGNIKRAVKAYYDQVNQMVLSQKPDIVGHMDKVKMHNKGKYFSEEEDWYIQLWMGTLELIRQCGLVIEVNTRGIYTGRCPDLYPGYEILKEIHSGNIPITLSADAHAPEEVDGHYPQTIKILKEIGFRELWFISPGGWKSQAI